MHNPYQPPAASLSPPPPLVSNPEVLRREHLTHESSVKSVGALYLLGAFILAASGIASLVASFSAESETPPSTLIAVLALFSLLILLQTWLGLGLRRLNPAVRIPTAILSAFGLLGFPLGTLISTYIMYLVLSKKGKTVFSPEYKAVIAATPHIRYRLSLITRIFIWLLVAILALVIISIAISYSTVSAAVP